jgi:hypothetical protein
MVETPSGADIGRRQDTPTLNIGTGRLPQEIMTPATTRKYKGKEAMTRSEKNNTALGHGKKTKEFLGKT